MNESSRYNDTDDKMDRDEGRMKGCFPIRQSCSHGREDTRRAWRGDGRHLKFGRDFAAQNFCLHLGVLYRSCVSSF